MATRKQGFVYPNPPIKVGSAVHLHLLTYAEQRNLSLGQAINALLGDWADALDGKPNPFGTTLLVGHSMADSGEALHEQRQRTQQEREAHEREQRVASTASQWL